MRPPKNNTGKTVGGVRPGQRTPFRKATQKEVSDRVGALSVELLTNPTAKHGELKEFCKSRFKVSYRQAEEYIARAKEHIVAQSQMTRAEARSLGVGVLVETIRTEKGSVKIAAEKRLGEIFGYNAPTHLRVGDPHGKPMAPAVIAPTINFMFPANTRGTPQIEHHTNGNGADTKR